MKKLICFILFLFFVTASATEVTIPEDFYSNDGKLIKKGAIIAENILPNALRVCICEGEKYELYADLLPAETTEKEINWRIKEGFSAVSISPQKEKCMLFAKKPGNAKIQVTAPGGASAEISVDVTKAKEIKPEITELPIPERPKPKEYDGKMARGLAKILVIMSGIMFFIAAYLRRSERKKKG